MGGRSRETDGHAGAERSGRSGGGVGCIPGRRVGEVRLQAHRGETRASVEGGGQVSGRENSVCVCDFVCLYVPVCVSTCLHMYACVSSPPPPDPTSPSQVPALRFPQDLPPPPKLPYSYSVFCQNVSHIPLSSLISPGSTSDPQAPPFSPVPPPRPRPIPVGPSSCSRPFAWVPT